MIWFQVDDYRLINASCVRQIQLSTDGNKPHRLELTGGEIIDTHNLIEASAWSITETAKEIMEGE